MHQFEPGKPAYLSVGEVPVRRILGLNPGLMTGPGTNSYLIGTNRLCILDPGPADESQYENFMRAIGSAKLEAIVVTHTHGDHSPGARRLAETTGAKMIGLAAPLGPGQDMTFAPDRGYANREVLDFSEYKLELIYTPGHVSNHVCYLLQETKVLFTGDHILQGTTSVILPPDGSMQDYLKSLSLLRDESIHYLAPGHGGVMDEPMKEIDLLIAHRLKREKKIFERLRSLGACNLEKLVIAAYDDVEPHLLPWAKKTLLAHLIKLKAEGFVEEVGNAWKVEQGGSAPNFY